MCMCVFSAHESYVYYHWPMCLSTHQPYKALVSVFVKAAVLSKLRKKMEQ